MDLLRKPGAVHGTRRRGAGGPGQDPLRRSEPVGAGQGYSEQSGPDVGWDTEFQRVPAEQGGDGLRDGQARGLHPKERTILDRRRGPSGRTPGTAGEPAADRIYLHARPRGAGAALQTGSGRGRVHGADHDHLPRAGRHHCRLPADGIPGRVDAAGGLRADRGVRERNGSGDRAEALRRADRQWHRQGVGNGCGTDRGGRRYQPRLHEPGA